MKNTAIKMFSLTLCLIMALLAVSCGNGDATTLAPVTDAPITDAPVTDAPVTDAPVTDAPVTDAPETEAPKPTNTDYTIPVKVDTYVDQSNANSALSGEDKMRIKHAGGLYRYAYVEFDVAELIANPAYTSVELALTVNWMQGTGAVEIYGCNVGADLKAMTFNNRIEPTGKIITARNDVTTGGVTYTFPITDYVRKAIAKGQTSIILMVGAQNAQPDTDFLDIMFRTTEKGDGAPKLNVSFTKVDSNVYEDVDDDMLGIE